MSAWTDTELDSIGNAKDVRIATSHQPERIYS